MHIPNRRVLAVILLVLAGLTLLSIGVAGAQSEAPAPTPVPGIDQQPAAPSADAPAPAAKDKDDGRVLTNSKSLKGKIQPASDIDHYFFFATEGQSVTVSMTATSGNLDGYMMLYDAATETVLATDDDSGGNLNPRISNYVVSRSGRYKVILNSWNAGSTGNYNISAIVSGNDPNDNRVLTSGKLLSGTISPASDLDHYFFWAAPGQYVTIEMWKSGGSLDSYLLLYDEYGSLIASDDDSGADNDALISNALLTNSGFYHVVARGYSTSTGAYKIKETLSKPNLALNKASTAWNWHAPWFLPEYGNDGNQSTRWAGDDGTNWWWVDLGSQMKFSQVKINWEAAYAAEYFVGWSNAPNCLGNYDGFYYTASSAGWKTHNLGSRTARCVAVRMDVPVYWAANYSFWEFEVYNLVGNGSPLSSQPDSIVVDVLPEADFGEESLIQLELTPASAQE